MRKQTYPRAGGASFWGFCVGAALGAGLLGAATPAAGQAIPFGGRTAAMGGTGIAHGDDSAMPVLNPAGVALVSSTTLSLSASLYAFHHVDVPHFNADADTLSNGFQSIEVSQQGVASNTVETLPSSLAYMLHLSPGNVFAASVTIPRSTTRRFVQNLDLASKDPTGQTGFVVRDQLTFVENYGQFVLGLSYAHGFGDRLRLGATLGTVYTSSLVTTQADRRQFPANASEFDHIVDNLTRDSSSLDLTGIFGIQYDLTDRFSVGGVVHSPALHVKGRWEFNQDNDRVETAGTSSASKVREFGDSIDAPPMKLGAGAHYRHGDCWAVALDVTASLAIKNDRRIKATRTESSVTAGSNPTASTTSIDRERQRVNRVNASVGGELRVGDEQWIRAGLFTDLSLDPAVGDNTDFAKQLDRAEVLTFPFNRYGGTVGLGTITGPVDSTVGLAVAYGSGDTVRLDPLRRRAMMGDVELQRTSLEKTSARLFDVMFFVTGTVDFKKAAGGVGGKLGGS